MVLGTNWGGRVTSGINQLFNQLFCKTGLLRGIPIRHILVDKDY